MKLNNDFKRESYSDPFLKETARILGLPETFRFTIETMGTKIEVDSTKLQQLASLCDWNQQMREQFNKIEVENGIEKMNPNWPYEVVKHYFNIEF